MSGAQTTRPSDIRWSMNGKSEPNSTRPLPTWSTIDRISDPVICEPQTSSQSES